MRTIKVKTQEGKVLVLSLENTDIKKIQSSLEMRVGIKMKDYNYGREPVVAMKFWISFPENCFQKQKSTVFREAKQLFAFHHAAFLGGFIAHDVVNGKKDLETVRVLVPNAGGATLINIGDYFSDLLFEPAIYAQYRQSGMGEVKVCEVKYVTKAKIIEKEFDKINNWGRSKEYVAQNIAKTLLFQNNPDLRGEVLSAIDEVAPAVKEKIESILRSPEMVQYIDKFETNTLYDPEIEGVMDFLSYEEMLAKAISMEKYEFAAKLRDKIFGKKQDQSGEQEKIGG